MTAGIAKVRQIPRCGCCDRPQAFAICARCDEPMCVDHFVRSTDVDGSKRYECTLCHEAQLTALVPPVAAGGAA